MRIEVIIPKIALKGGNMHIQMQSKLSISVVYLCVFPNQGLSVKASLTFKCMTEHLFADFSYSIALDTYLWKQMMQMNRKLIHIWYNVDKKHLLFTKRKCHKFSWLFTASRCSPRRRSTCVCRIASKVLVSIGLYSLSFGFLKKGFLLGKPCL